VPTGARETLTVRGLVGRKDVRALMKELARSLPRGRSGRAYLVGGGTAVWEGWRASTVDVDLHGEPEGLFRDIQGIKERLAVNVEFARPEDFVPPLAGSDDRHLFIERIGGVSFHHHDPYAQAFSKIVRGFDRDLEDAERFVTSGMVDPARLKILVHDIPEATYAKYPALSRAAVTAAVDAFVQGATASA
jgi:hypothetical protein